MLPGRSWISSYFNVWAQITDSKTFPITERKLIDLWKLKFVCYCISLELEQWKLFSNNFQIRRSTSVSEMVWSELELQLWSIFLHPTLHQCHWTWSRRYFSWSFESPQSYRSQCEREDLCFMRTLVATSLCEQSILVKSLLSSLD